MKEDPRPSSRDSLSTFARLSRGIFHFPLGGDFTLPTDTQRLRDMRSPSIHKVQGLRPDSAIRTLDPVTLEAHDGRGLPPQQMPYFLLMAVVFWKTCFPARAASIGFFQTLDGDKHPPKSAPVFDPNIADLKSWKIQKRRDKFVRHPMSPPYCHLAVNHTELSYPHRVLFLPTLSRQEP